MGGYEGMEDHIERMNSMRMYVANNLSEDGMSVFVLLCSLLGLSSVVEWVFNDRDACCLLHTLLYFQCL